MFVAPTLQSWMQQVGTAVDISSDAVLAKLLAGALCDHEEMPAKELPIGR